MLKPIVAGISLFMASVTFASGVDDSVWRVVGKTCDSQNVAIHGEEKVQFASGTFAYIFQYSEDATQTCKIAQAFIRAPQSSGNTGTVYTEKATLLPQHQRLVCLYKSSGTPVSDKTIPWKAPPQMLSVMVSAADGTGSAEWTGSTLCLNGVLRLVLSSK